MNRQTYEAELMEMASALDDDARSKFIYIIQTETQNPVALFGWNIWLGWLGIDRFIVGDILLGILKLITLGFGGIWVLVDCFLIGNRTRYKNMLKARAMYEALQQNTARRNVYDEKTLEKAL